MKIVEVRENLSKEKQGEKGMVNSYLKNSFTHLFNI